MKADEEPGDDVRRVDDEQVAGDVRGQEDRFLCSDAARRTNRKRQCKTSAQSDKVLSVSGRSDGNGLVMGVHSDLESRTPAEGIEDRPMGNAPRIIDPAHAHYRHSVIGRGQSSQWR
ncbi:hypothetical protein AB0M43_36620 [Longispora sp. NPDC051575]|uniref:hypothetical protein n=1 Tax=Longispora sp. NPDC051575 TaxID=3154943 RepID=UPI0034331ECB